MRYFLRRLSQYFLLFTTVQTVIVDRRGWIWLGSSAFKQNKILASDMCTRNDLLLLFVCFACVRARARARVCVCVCESVRACVRACVCVCVLTVCPWGAVAVVWSQRLVCHASVRLVILCDIVQNSPCRIAQAWQMPLGALD